MLLCRQRVLRCWLQANRVPLEHWYEYVHKSIHKGIVSPVKAMLHQQYKHAAESFGEFECSPRAFLSQAGALRQLMCTHSSQEAGEMMNHQWRPIPVVILVDQTWDPSVRTAETDVERKLFEIFRTIEGAPPPACKSIEANTR